MSPAKSGPFAILGTLLLGLFAIGAPAVVPRAEAVQAKPQAIEWQTCPQYTDEELRAQGVRDNELAEYRRLLGRLECGTLSVPQNYADPRGEQISIGVTRLKATDQAHRLGSLALNPGGPGGSGYLMPIEVVRKGAELDRRYDLIGFDPRGVGHSTKVKCPVGEGRPQPGPVTEKEARKLYDDMVKRTRECARSDPAFLSRLTTANVARDVDRIRAALDEPKISFYGVSWGTGLGVVLRSLFPGKVGRMWLDSVMHPDFWSDAISEDRPEAAARDFQRMAAWIAERNAVYGLGTSRRQVAATLERMRRSYDADPLTFTDIDLTVDGHLISQAAGSASPMWPRVAQVFAELLDAEGPTAPPAVKEMFGGGPPGGKDVTAGLAIHCNEDPSATSFEAGWRAYQERLKRYPVTAQATPFLPKCAGWPFRTEKPRLRPVGGSLMLSAHRHESATPYAWAPRMQAAVGGTLATIDDDVHGSALRVPGCAAKIVAYFETGRRTTTCPGVPTPT
ncbi:TAP-like protein [Actinomadura madurae]|uniref:TAP-like protein n=1 Tax=Actinomadura madurae TaxID=1993 RepID=A0A1I5G6B0_9ACTN|nr:TAP-like protein [Actinomadura madurae]